MDKIHIKTVSHESKHQMNNEVEETDDEERVSVIDLVKEVTESVKKADIQNDYALKSDNKKHCAAGWSYYKSSEKCYMFVQEKITWTNAKIACKTKSPSKDGTLASVTDKQLNMFLASLTNGSKALIGGYKTSGKWSQCLKFDFIDYCSMPSPPY